MQDVVTYQREDQVGVIVIDSPPVNALGHAVRDGLARALEQGLSDDRAAALVVIGAGRTFPAGADIREFGQTPQPPSLPDVIDRIEASGKIVIAAIHGTALGGGMEVTLGCDYRVALDSARLGFPEVNLGLLPGAGGTQRLPRLIGARAAMEIIVAGKPLSAHRWQELGVVDVIVSDDLKTGALDYARRLIADKAPRRPLRELTVAPENADVFSEFEQSIARRKRGFLAPFRCIEAVRAATELAFDAGIEREQQLFMELLHSPQSAAQRHVFFAEREVAKIPGLDKHTPKRAIERVGIIGAGTMGGGIAMNFLGAGIPVTLLDMEREALDKGVALIRSNYAASAKKGRMTGDQVAQCMARLDTTLDYADFAQVDMVIEAVFEDMSIKKKVFGELDRVCKAQAILATNTSTLDIDAIAAVTSRPRDVMGTHFFSPANVMKLMENVRGEATADAVVATVMDVSKRIGKIGVLVGVCYGFVGNRMLHKRQTQATALVNEGASPAQVDRVLVEFGLPMGPFAMADLAGLDVGWRIRAGLRESDPDNAPARTWLDALAEQNRHGQKTGAGVFDYAEGDRTPRPSEVTAAQIERYRAEQGIVAREIGDDEIRERCLYVMVNEGARILEEGIARRALDIDIVWVHGYGFPVYRGGIMYWADRVGLDTILARVQRFYQATGDSDWRPAALLETLVRDNRGFADL